MTERTDDLRSLPDETVELYLYGIGAWGLAFIGLFAMQMTALAIPLTYLVFAYHAVLTGWWGSTVLAEFDAGRLGWGEAHAGVLSVSRLLLSCSALPAIVFLAEDPLASSAWTAATGTVIVAVVTYLIILLLTRLSRAGHMVSLALASIALPVNATGAVSVAITSGFFDRVFLPAG